MRRGRSRIAHASGNRRGFALLIVLWTLVLLGLLVTHLTAAGRSEARIAGNFAANAVAEAAADGVVYEAIFHLMEGSWATDSLEHRLKLSGGAATVRIDTEAGKINPNIASVELMTALLRVVGVETRRAQALAEAIADWREPVTQARPNGAKLPQYRAAGLDYGPPGAPFESFDELGRVLGMTPDLLDQLRPHLSLYQLGSPDPKLADKLVAQALSLLPDQPGQALFEPQPGEVLGLLTVTIDAEAHTGSNGSFLRRAVIRIGPAFERGYQILAWDTPGRE
jgi:general secretion pathway protein K